MAASIYAVQEIPAFKFDHVRSFQPPALSPFFPFFNLPNELRDMVYDEVLVDRSRSINPHPRMVPQPSESTDINFSGFETSIIDRERQTPTSKVPPGILFVCKQMTEEALPILHGRNRFEYTSSRTGVPFLEQHFDKLRYLTITVPEAVNHRGHYRKDLAFTDSDSFTYGLNIAISKLQTRRLRLHSLIIKVNEPYVTMRRYAVVFLDNLERLLPMARRIEIQVPDFTTHRYHKERNWLAVELSGRKRWVSESCSLKVSRLRVPLAGTRWTLAKKSKDAI